MEPLHEHIDDLIADKLSGQISPQDDLQLTQLIEADEAVHLQWEHSKALVSYYQVSHKFSKVNESDAWNNIANKLTVETEAVQLKANNFKWIAAASVLVPLLIAGLWFGLFKKDFSDDSYGAKNESVKVTLSDGTTYDLDESEVTTGQIHFGSKSASKLQGRNNAALSNEIITLSIPNGKTYALVLNDGTSVKINSASTLKFPLVFNGDKWQVELDGEAYFEVAKNGKQFVVKTDVMDVNVLGTKFNVNTYPGNAAQTSLIEGSVAISNPNQLKATIIVPGQAVVKRAEETLVVEQFSMDHVLSWLNGSYYFNNMPLREIVNITNRVTGEDLYITNSKIANLRFSGALEIDKPIKVLLENIKASSSQVQYATKNGRIELF